MDNLIYSEDDYYITRVRKFSYKTSRNGKKATISLLDTSMIHLIKKKVSIICKFLRKTEAIEIRCNLLYRSASPPDTQSRSDSKKITYQCTS